MPLDKQLQQAVLAELDWEPSVVAVRIGVTVNAGVVTLTGHVETFAGKNAAETAARRVQKEAAGQNIARLQGVTGVSSEIVVKPVVDVSDISTRIRRALHRSWLLDDENVTVRADGGHVQLTGTVHSPHDRHVAWATAWAAPGDQC